MRVGFPVVDESGNTFSVWGVLTPSAEGTGKASWNDLPLDPNHAFADNVTAHDNLLGVLREKYDVRFQCDGPFTVENGCVNLGGSSAGLFMVCTRHLEPLDGNLDVLLSGWVNGTLLSPLGEKGRLREKIRHAVNSGALLIIHANDAELAFPNGETDQIRVVQSTEVKDKDALLAIYGEALPRGMVLALAPDNWLDTLRSLLGGGEGSFASPEIVKKARGLDDMALFSDKTFGDLYRASVPSMDEQQFQKFIKDNAVATLEDPRLFLDGILDRAVKKAPEIFHDAGLQSGTARFLKKHLLVGGPTGCGKTELALCLMLNTITECDGQAIYVAPTKMLVYEVADKFRTLLGSQSSIVTDEDVIISTGEDIEQDWRLASSDFRAAFIVYEKANLFTEQKRFTNNLSLVIADEIHMITDKVRGGILDLLLAKAFIEAAERVQDESAVTRPLRVVGITTENVSEDSGLGAYFTHPSEGAPVTLISTQRPVPVTHSLQRWSKPHNEFYQVMPIGRFADQSDRILSDGRIKELKELMKRQPSHRKDISFDTCIQEHMAGHRKIIIACTGRESILKRANAIVKSRSEDERLTKDEQLELDQLCLEANISKRDRKMIMKFAKKGIFLHYSTLDRQVRRAMEKLFKSSPGENDNPDVLLAMETITYGVNLPADCLILTGINFMREDPQTGNTVMGQLTAHQYHNMLGRVGRFGTNFAQDIPAKVIVIVQNLNAANAVLNFYSSLATCNPGGVTQKDLETVRTETLVDLVPVSYSAFRATLDALRYAENPLYGATAADVYRVLRNTIFWQYNVAARENDLKELISTLLDLAKDLSADPHIVEDRTPSGSSVKRYAITDEGSSLIDTGTRWQSIPPLSDWLKKLRDMSVAHSVLINNVEILLPAFIVCSELWNQFRAFCEESRRTSIGQVSHGLIIAKKLLCEELRHLAYRSNGLPVEGVDAGILLIMQEIESLFRRHKNSLRVSISPNNSVDEYGLAMYLRMISCMLMWLRGAPMDKINPLSLLDPSKAEEQDMLISFSERYAQKTSWMVSMCLRFFSRREDTLLESHRLELSQLAERLRCGLPTDGLPFYKSYIFSGGLSRTQVMSIIEKGITPGKLITNASPADLLKNNRELPESIRRDAHDIVARVFKYYNAKMRELCDVFQRSNQEDWSAMPRLISKVFQACRLKDTGDQEWSDTINEFKINIAGILNNDDVSAIDNLDAPAILIQRPQGSKILMQLASPDETVPDPRIPRVVVRLPWKIGGGCECPEFGLFGGITLGLLLSRRFLTVSTTLRWIKETPPGLYRIRDILGIDGALAQLPKEIYEALLAIDEPRTF